MKELNNNEIQEINGGCLTVFCTDPRGSHGTVTTFPWWNFTPFLSDSEKH